MRICKTKNCRNKAEKHRTVCGKCRSKKYRKNNPVRAAYMNLKCNARRRKKEFDISFEDFQKFAVDTEYILGKGRFKESLHIDRINENKGYTLDNIQVLTNTKNVKKHLRYRFGENGKPELFWFEKQPDIKNTETPF